MAILPGEVFGRASEELTARLAYVDFDGACALAAAETIPIQEPLPAEFIRERCGKILDAAHLIVEWATREGR